jgi:hypothetical protein
MQATYGGAQPTIEGRIHTTAAWACAIDERDSGSLPLMADGVAGLVREDVGTHSTQVEKPSSRYAGAPLRYGLGRDFAQLGNSRVAA